MQRTMVAASSSSRPSRPLSRSTAQLVGVLRDRIRAGYYPPGDRLPTERELAEDLGADRRMVRTAINALAEAGLVYRRPNCRPVVAAPLDAAEAPGVQKAAPPLAGPGAADPDSDFVALIMWPGDGVVEHSAGSQQRIFWGMNQALTDVGRHAVFLGLAQIGREEETAASEADRLRYALDRGFGGVVFYPYAYRSNHALIREVSRRMPFVMIDRRLADVATDFVGIDNRQGTYDVTRHMIAQGHRRVAYVTKCEQIPPVQDRIQGYIDAVREAGVPEIILTIPSRDREEDWLVTDTVFRLPLGERPTAAVVFNDYATVDFLYRLQRLGLSVPGDVALGGFDNIAEILPNGVGLTTVAQPYEEIGRAAVELLLRRIADPAAPVRTVELPANLVIRASSAPPSY